MTSEWDKKEKSQLTNLKISQQYQQLTTTIKTFYQLHSVDSILKLIFLIGNQKLKS